MKINTCEDFCKQHMLGKKIQKTENASLIVLNLDNKVTNTFKCFCRLLMLEK